jgi:hypothetical protein
MTRATLLVSLASFVLMLAIPATAAADPPTVEVAPISFTRLDAGLTAACGFAVTITSNGERRTTFFSDGRVVTHRQVTVVYSANGKSVTNNQTATFVDEGGMRTVTGNVFNINIPGYGVVVQGTGRVVFDLDNPAEFLFEAGQHEALSALCAYLGP